MREQLDFFTPKLQQTMEDFLAAWLALEEEEDRLRDNKLNLKAEYAEQITMRAVLTAVKVVRAQMKLHYHKKEPTLRTHQVFYEHLVRNVLEQQRKEHEAIQEAAEALVRPINGTTVTITTDEAREGASAGKETP